MLSLEEIRKFIDEDKASKLKQKAKEGLRYYEGDNDIKGYRFFYYNKDGKLVEDKNVPDVKTPSGFFAELVDQKTQFTLSIEDSIVKSDIPELQAELDNYFNDDFVTELGDVITYGSAEGFSYVYRFKNEDDRSEYKFAEALGIVEVEAKYASDNQDHVILYYEDKIKKNDTTVIKIQDWDKDYTYFYEEVDNEIKVDASYEMNPRPHILYTDPKGKQYYDTFGVVPFYRYDNNRKRFSDLKPIKDFIDSYDIINVGLYDNILSMSEGYFCVKGFQGDNLDELINNLRVKKHIGVPETGELSVQTVDIPYEARKAKMELDEKNIYRFGMGLNTSQMAEGNYNNGVSIKSRYALLDLKCNKCVKQVKKLLTKILKDLLVEINEINNTDYSIKDCYFNLDEREVITNELDNANIKQIEANTKQIEVNTLLNVQTLIDNETLMKQLCDILEVDYEEIKDKLPENEEDLNQDSENILNGLIEPKEEVEPPVEE